MLVFIVFFIFINGAANASKNITANLETHPVNNANIIPPFPVANLDATAWDIKLKEYIYSYQIRYGNIGDKFVLPEDMDLFLTSLPHGTKDRPAIKPEEQNKISSIFDDEYEQNIVDQYFRMQYRVMAPTMK